ncbi:ribonuclease H-like domain-containing protein [Tanacetum coccineum]
MSTHPMVTRAKADIFKPLERMNCHVTTTSPLPRSHVHALRDPNWKEAMLDEYNALITNGTWVLVPRPANVNVVRSMSGLIHQLDVKNCLSVKVHLTETVYSSTTWVVDSVHLDYHSKTDTSLFVFHRGPDVAYLLLYVDDIILTASSTTFLQRIISLLHGEFAMTDLGSLNYFLGVSAQRTASGMFLSQSKFVVEILERANMQKCNPCKTPVDTESKLGPDGEPVSDPTLYRSLVGALHLLLRRSTLDNLYFLVMNLLSWSAKRHVTLSRSSAEAEYRGVANVVAETVVVYLSTNPVQHQRTKHIEIDIHFVRDYVASGQVRVLHVPSRYQYADIFTKGLPSALFLEFRSSLNVRRSPVHTEGEY